MDVVVTVVAAVVAAIAVIFIGRETSPGRTGRGTSSGKAK